MSHRDRRLREEIESHLRMAIRDRMERGESAAEAEVNARREIARPGAKESSATALAALLRRRLAVQADGEHQAAAQQLSERTPAQPEVVAEAVGERSQIEGCVVYRQRCAILSFSLHTRLFSICVRAITRRIAARYFT